ncbi:hypothetical protein ACJIZ3_010098 [Penstemon smallii]|uniref:Uncharacterized protein n=1 Tax=Penstemon smallii TaxID=265156 RepID=A0ABD3TEZ7_9LAMI
MGCGVSRIDANGMVVPARLWPIFLQRQEEFPMHKHNSPINKDSTPTKKEPLLHDIDDDDNNISGHHHSLKASKTIPEEPKEKEAEKAKGEAPNKGSSEEHVKPQVVKEESSKGKGRNSQKESTMAKEDTKKEEEDAFTDTDYEDVDDDYDDERMIGHDDNAAFPRSPSFRVFFKDNGKDYHNDIGKNDAYKVPSDDDAMSPKHSLVKTNVKRGRGRKRRSFKLPKGLNVKSCYTPSHSSHAHLLPAPARKGTTA